MQRGIKTKEEIERKRYDSKMARVWDTIYDVTALEISAARQEKGSI